MVFSGLLCTIVILYLGDIICHSKTFEEQLVNLELVFERLRKANLKLNPKKCHLFQTQVTFLGHSISQNGIGTLSSKIWSIKNWPTPRNAKEAQSFISLASYYSLMYTSLQLLLSWFTNWLRKKGTFNGRKNVKNPFLPLRKPCVVHQYLLSPLKMPICGRYWCLWGRARGHIISNSEWRGKGHKLFQSLF